MDNIGIIHQYGNIAVQRWQNSAFGTATLPRGVELTSCHFIPILGFLFGGLSVSDHKDITFF